MKTTATRLAGVLAALALVATACGADPAPTTTTPAVPTAEPVDLAGTRWLATSLFLAGAPVPLAPNARPTIEFGEDGRTAGGTTGCNSWFADVSLGVNTIEFGGLAMTEMACEQHLMRQESDVLDVLRNSSTFALAGDRLTIGQVGGSALEFLDRAAAVPDEDLAGTDWVADTIFFGEAAQTLVPGTTVTFFLDDGGAVNGSAGCNLYSGSAEIDSTRIRFGEMTMTEKACAGDGIMQQEDLVLSVLSGEVEFEIDGTRLTIYGAGGAGISFTPG